LKPAEKSIDLRYHSLQDGNLGSVLGNDESKSTLINSPVSRRFLDANANAYSILGQ